MNYQMILILFVILVVAISYRKLVFKIAFGDKFFKKEDNDVYPDDEELENGI